MRWTRQCRARKGSQGGFSVSGHPVRRRPALKRLRQNFGRQHMSRSKCFGVRKPRTAKACGPGTRGWCQADGDLSGPTGLRLIANPSATVARGIRRRGERAISRKTIAQGRPGVPAHLAVTRVHFCARSRVLRAPGFPCALFVFEGIADRITPGALRRENVKACLLVGWVERSETHHRPAVPLLMGIASLHPSYGSTVLDHLRE
jgi:hypothetical protein